MKKQTRVSIIIPVYNEEKTILKIVNKVRALPFPKEIIIVDDGSSDRTPEKLKTIKGNYVTVCCHPRNLGKGAAFKTGCRLAKGDIIAVQDADLEYNPNELLQLINPIKEGKVDVVYGSRFLTTRHPMSVYYIGNRFLTYFTQLLFLRRITDMETCYKIFRREVLDGMQIRSNRFNLEPEITAKVLKNRKIKFLELPISYKGRTHKEGKKITWKDGIYAAFTLLRYRLFN